MSANYPPPIPGPIRITSEEANSPHVDDLLSRQASLRGEGGISRTSRGKWYLQNWFIFMIAGALAAVGAWALLEPYFDDMLYIQGPVQDLDADESMPQTLRRGNMEFEIRFSGSGWVKISGEKIWIASEAKSMLPDGGRGAVDLGSIQRGQQLGVYLPSEPYDQIELAMALLVDPAPPADPPEKASMTLAAQSAQSSAAGMLLFPTVAALIGLAIGASDGIICRVARRALLGGFIGLLVGFIGGFVFSIVAGLAYAPLTMMAMKQEGDTVSGLSTFGFLIQMGGRALGWCLAGVAMGLGQGIALRSSRLLLYGLLGGVIGGLLGGLLFDPIDLLLLGGATKPSAHWSRLAGLGVIGSCVGMMIGVVELLARDAWLQMTRGPLAGKEFLIFKDTMILGSAPRCEIYLFNDDQVAGQHAVIRSVGDNYEIDNLCDQTPAEVNGKAVTRKTRLRSDDQITIGRTMFIFQKRKR